MNCGMHRRNIIQSKKKLTDIPLDDKISKEACTDTRSGLLENIQDWRRIYEQQRNDEADFKEKLAWV